MSQPVKLSDALVLDARVAGEAMQRSIAGQVEFWARLGRAVEPLLRGDRAIALSRSASARPLFELLATVDTDEGAGRVSEHLATLPHPHYAPAPEGRGLLVRTDADGKRTMGRFVRRRFVAVRAKSARS